MISLRNLIGAILLPASICMAQPESVIFDNALQTENWSFKPGAEHAGASGKISLSRESGKVKAETSFSGRSQYAGVEFKRRLPEDTRQLFLTVKADCNVDVAFRLSDADGRNFQSDRTTLTAGKATDLACDLTGNQWEAKWGGKQETDSPKLPLRNFQLLINRGADPAVTLEIDSLRIAAPGINTRPFTGEDFRFSAFGTTVTGKWVNGNSPVLNLTVSAPANFPAGTVLAVSFPDMYRDKVERYAIVPGKSVEYRYAAPMELGGNPSNTYVIDLTLERDGGAVARSTTALKGAESRDWNRTLTTAEVSPDSIVGTAVHFNFAFSPGGDYGVWNDYPRLLSMMSAAGIKYLRDDYWFYEHDDGTFPKYPEFIKRLKAAKALGFKTIAILPLMADRPAANVCENIGYFVKATGDLVDVYELGNEPHNFGGWIQTFGGQWNAHDGDGKTSKWMVEFARISNAAADHLRKLRPDAVIIGAGAVTGANIHFLRQGVSPALNGIVDHPYTYMLPPERLSFGTQFNKRDGVIAGGDDFTLRGVVDAYLKAFDAAKCKDLSLYFTEFGYSTYVHNGDKETDQYGYAGFTEDTQATYILRQFLQCMTIDAVKAVVQYDFIDDLGGEQHNPEGNFGMVRTDGSPKPVYFAMQRLTTLFDGAKYVKDGVKVTAQPQQRASRRDVLIDWDGSGNTVMKADNDVHAHAFDTTSGRMIAAWQGIVPDAAFSLRIATLRVPGAARSVRRAVGTDLVSGKRFDVPTVADGNDLVLTLALGNHPVAVTLN